MPNLADIFKIPAFANDNDNDGSAYAFGDLARNIVARITDQTVNKFKPLLSGLQKLEASDEFTFQKNNTHTELQHYTFQINDDPDSFLDIFIDHDKLCISNPLENEALMGFDIDGAFYTKKLIPFENNISALLYIKEFIEDNHPNFSLQTIDQIAVARDHIRTLESQLKHANPAYNHG